MSGDIKGARSGPEENRLQGHWLLAKMGKRVLRPGGLEMTTTLLKHANLQPTQTVVEFGPGVGKTASLLLQTPPSSYIGVDPHTEGTSEVSRVLKNYPYVASRLVAADAKDTGLEDGVADMVMGEAMLTMMSPVDKMATMREAARLLKPGGKYVIHEMGLTPDDIAPEVAGQLQKEISRTIKVGARPLTMPEWQQLLTEAGLAVEFTYSNSMSLLEPKRLLADEGVVGALRIVKNMITNPAGRKRMLAMRAIFTEYADNLCAVGVIATKPIGS
ncbi:class I SAM-dependent methyltransferase [Arcanobacterium phocae]|uniref:class I SAM-dependent methyltransferase n=1 Tax=Arcanobacterium phocae TaxID=131112 RepID=UPI001C0EADF3|nr:class I SAM-dependent methyltransferase [Arcanobacterium phocae]